MKLVLPIITLFSLIHASFGKDVAVGDAFTISLPDTVKEQTRSQHSYGFPDTILPKYHDDSFQLFMYRWPDVKPTVPLNQIPELWAKNKEWASVSDITEGKTDAGILYVTFKTRIVEDQRRPFDSVMTVLRSSSGEAYMFQMTGDGGTIDAIRDTIKHK